MSEDITERRGRGLSPSENELANTKRNRPPVPTTMLKMTIEDVAKNPANGGNPKVVLDEDNVFMLYAAFCGNVDRTATAAGITCGEVLDLIAKNNWTEKIRGLIELRKTEAAGVVEQEISRAMNFVQVQRYRLFLEKVIRNLINMSENDLFKFLVNDRIDKNGKVTGQVFSTRPLADIASAMEKVHWMSYQALGDTPQDRARRKEGARDAEHTECDVHARIAKALAGMPSEPIKLLREAHAEEAAFLKTLPADQPLGGPGAIIMPPGSKPGTPLPVPQPPL